jgi:hypothetical protein
LPKREHDTIALLDVDNTLVSGTVTSRELYINEALVQRLLAVGITQAWLFTDMKTNARSVAEREVVIDAITRLGMTVLGVSTPCDYAWGINDAGREARLPPPDRKTVQGQTASPTEWPEADTLPHLPLTQPGIAYGEARRILYAHKSVAELKTEEEKNTRFRQFVGDSDLSSDAFTNLDQKAEQCRTIAGREAKEIDNTGVKGRMYDQIVAHYLEKNPTEQPLCLLFIDDKAKELRTVRERHNNTTPDQRAIPWELHTLPVYQLEERGIKGLTSHYSLEPAYAQLRPFSLPWFPYLSLSIEYDSLHDDAKKNDKGLNALMNSINAVLYGSTPIVPLSAGLEYTTQTPTPSTEGQTQTLTISLLTPPNSQLLDKLKTEKASNLTTRVDVAIVPVKKGLIAFLALFLLGGGTAATLSVALFAASKHFSDQARDWVTHLIGEQAFQYVLPTALGLAGAGLIGLLYCAYRHCKLNALKNEVEAAIEPSTLTVQ